ncbi:hypothetical protein [Rheinheimera sp.]|uniref:hypothetical protein n=1 Tax=Rheinheimera sp. TaxID=1869214 RepID=UPI00307E2F87
MQNQTIYPLDKGLLRVVIGQYPKKENGQQVYNGNKPVMANKYMTIGEVTRWPGENGGSYDSVEFYPGFTILDTNKEGRIFWDSQNQQGGYQAPAQGGYQQAAPQGGYQQHQHQGHQQRHTTQGR